jgi:hypothetical protein
VPCCKDDSYSNSQDWGSAGRVAGSVAILDVRKPM